MKKFWNFISNTKFSDALNYNRIYFDMTAQIKTLLQKNVRILIYNGDVDTACNVMMNGR